MDLREWLEADGLGGFASGTVARRCARAATTRCCSRRARRRPAAWCWSTASTPGWRPRPGRYAIASQRYAPATSSHPDGARPSTPSSTSPGRAGRFALEDGTRVEQEIFVRARPSRWRRCRWRLPSRGPASTLRAAARSSPAATTTRCTTRTPRFRFAAAGRRASASSGAPYRRRAGDRRARQRRATRTSRLVPPLPLRRGAGARARPPGGPGLAGRAALRPRARRGGAGSLASRRTRLRARPRGAAALADAPARGRARAPPALRASRLQRAADAYLVAARRGPHDRRRLSRGSPTGAATRSSPCAACASRPAALDEAREILLEWAGAVSEGMLPNRFPDQRRRRPSSTPSTPRSGSSIAVHELLAVRRARAWSSRARLLEPRSKRILDGYARGTRYGIRADARRPARRRRARRAAHLDGRQVGDWVVTPRIGKPVEVQALWLNALSLAAAWWPSAAARYSPRGRAGVRARGSGTRPRLPVRRGRRRPRAGHRRRDVPPEPDPRGRRAAARAARRRARAPSRGRGRAAACWTPLGLRSLAPGEPGYAPRYEGGVPRARRRVPPGHGLAVADRPVRRGLGARARRHRRRARARRARASSRRCSRTSSEAGLGHVSEIADAEAPHTPRGCPFQAWSLGELLRIEALLLGSPPS